MTHDRDDLALRRALAHSHPSTYRRDIALVETDEGGSVGAGSALPLVDALVRRRTAALLSWREALGVFQLTEQRAGTGEQVAVEGLPCARDRVLAAKDRLDAANDRLLAAEFLLRSHRDRLTGALQRDAGEDRLNQELDRAGREGTRLVLAFLDVDGLKSVNDTLGHLAGDAVLRAVGSALLTCLRSYDVVVRYGGDEFVCMLSGLSLDEAEERFGQVATTLSAASPGRTITVGLAVSRPGETLQQVLHRADADLYSRRGARAVPRLPATIDVTVGR